MQTESLFSRKRLGITLDRSKVLKLLEGDSDRGDLRGVMVTDNEREA